MNKPDFKKLIPHIEEVIKKWKNSLTENDWGYISYHQILSEPFIEKYKDQVNWNYVSIRQKLSEPFIEKWKDKVNWSYISRFQILSEPFMEKWENKVNWYCISKYQKLSEPFIEKWKDILNFNNLINNKIKWNEFNEEFFNQFHQHFDLEEMNKKRPFSKSFCLKYNLDWRWS